MRAVAAFLAATASLTAVGAAQAESINCPATVETDKTTGGSPQSFKFRHVSFFDGDPAEMVDLAPDDASKANVLSQRWSFARTQGRTIVMVCRYHGTDATVRKNVPPEINECSLEGSISDKGEVQGSPTLTCR